MNFNKTEKKKIAYKKIVLNTIFAVIAIFLTAHIMIGYLNENKLFYFEIINKQSSILYFIYFIFMLYFRAEIYMAVVSLLVGINNLSGKRKRRINSDATPLAEGKVLPFKNNISFNKLNYLKKIDFFKKIEDL
ncbi:hypothetical protein [Poseidonibacter ostreae]|uniref:Uncharacterized protein n=1 Tax=Poseidonibacter ostreae TaxID=2654171 RepID=A0A6L4WWQ0_9BACT|nr:hypothetical protein [Poseidonibacter ostreae]KAB7891279.1 hypothetical protein GBG19_00150 [Poseidonibacter ostreae]